MKTSDTGYVNMYGQVNLGAVKRNGAHRCYRLHCLYCGETYGTNTIAKRGCNNGRCEAWRGRHYGWGKLRGRYDLTVEEKPVNCQERRRQAVEALHEASRR